MTQVSFVLQYNEPMDIYPNSHLSFENTLSLFVCLITCLLAFSHAFFLAYLDVFFPLLVCQVICLVLSMLICYFSACLLLVFLLFVVCTHKAQVQLLNASKKGK